MSTDSAFTFNLNVSTQPFPCKPTAFEAARITYETQTLNFAELEQRVRDGYAFCYNFIPTDSGILTQKDRHIERFDYTKTLFFDFDKMPQPMADFINSLSFKPSVAYTTYSNGTGGKYSYRLVYAFRLPISSEKEFERTYWSVANANGFKQMQYPDGTKYGLDYRKVNQQYYGGGSRTNTYHSDNTYFFNDFSAFTPSIINNIDKEKRVDNDYNNDCSKNIIINNYTIKKDSTSYSQVESGFLEDYFSLPSADFIDKYRSEYESVYLNSISTQLTLSSDGTHYVYPSNYMTIKRKIKWQDGKGMLLKWKDGEERRKKLYIAAKIMLNNNPDITLEQLVYCLVREKNDYYDNSDKQLHRDILLGIAKNAFAYRDVQLNSIKHPTFKVNKEYWQAKGLTPNQAKQVIKGVLKLQEVLNVYDFSKSVKENLETLHNLGIKVGKSYLYEFRKKYGDKPDASPEEIPIKNKDIEEESPTHSRMKIIYLDWVRNIFKDYKLKRRVPCLA